MDAFERALRRTLGDEKAKTIMDEAGVITAEALHECVDTISALYLLENPGALPSKTSVLDLIRWSDARVAEKRAAGKANAG